MVLFANAEIVDGTGAPAFRGDLAVEGDRIAAILPEGEAELRRQARSAAGAAVIDAAGALVTPGFIDAHAHSDAYLVLEPDAPSKITQGITTEINGQCGGSVAPRYGAARLSSDWAALLGDRLTWRSLGEYREVLERARPALNTVQFIGHNTLRSSVLGYAPRSATAEEVQELRRLLEQSLDEGGWGLSTGLIYQPGRYAQPEEVEALVAATAARGGFYATHMRSEGDELLESIDEVIALARRTGIRAEISHLKTNGPRNWGKIDAALAKIDAAVASGTLLGSDRYPFTSAATDLDVVLPDWAQAGAAPAECQRLADPALRTRIIAELNALDRDWNSVMIGGTWDAATRPCSGRTVAELAAERGCSPGEVIADLLTRDGCKTGAFFFGMSEDNLTKILAMPWIVPGSDASLRVPWGPLGADYPHPRAYATMPEFFRRLRRQGLSLPQAVARMTSLPARRFDLTSRGELKVGFFADLVLWCEERFASTSTYAAPHSFTAGVELVMVNGQIPYRNGRFTGERGGRLLERS